MIPGGRLLWYQVFRLYWFVRNNITKLVCVLHPWMSHTIKYACPQCYVVYIRLLMTSLKCLFVALWWDVVQRKYLCASSSSPNKSIFVDSVAKWQLHGVVRYGTMMLSMIYWVLGGIFSRSASVLPASRRKSGHKDARKGHSTVLHMYRFMLHVRIKIYPCFPFCVTFHAHYWKSVLFLICFFCDLHCGIKLWDVVIIIYHLVPQPPPLAPPPPTTRTITSLLTLIPFTTKKIMAPVPRTPSISTNKKQ